MVGVMIYSLFILVAMLLISIFFNIKQRRQIISQGESEISLVKRAYFDSVTELPNKENVKIVITEQIARTSRHQKSFLIVAIKVTNYNEVMLRSEQRAKELMIEASDRIFDLVRDEDTLARVSDNGFIVVFNEYLEAKDLRILYKRLKKAFMRKQIDDVEINISLGSSTYPTDSKEAKGLIDEATRNALNAK